MIQLPKLFKCIFFLSLCRGFSGDRGSQDCMIRMGILQVLKTQLLCHLIICYVFLVSGFIINLLQLCTLPLWPINKQLARKINCRLGYSISSRKSCKLSHVSSHLPKKDTDITSHDATSFQCLFCLHWKRSTVWSGKIVTKWSIIFVSVIEIMIIHVSPV